MCEKIEQETKISVIVPVYNAEQYIGCCVKSILMQTYSKWELLLIDDGSIDNSLNILKEYEKNDDRIFVLHQDNFGAGVARNKGIELATGEYIVFIDADDVIENDYFEKLSKKNADLVFIDVLQKNIDTGREKIEKLSIYNKYKKEDLLREQMTGKILWGGVRKAVKRSLLIEHSIKYSEHRIGEESIYSFEVLYFANNYDFIDTVVYTYMVHNDSLSHSLADDPWGDVALDLRNKVRELGCYENYANTLNAFIIVATVVSLNKMAAMYSYKDYIMNSRLRVHKMFRDLDQIFTIDFCHMDNRVKALWPLIKNKRVVLIYAIIKLRNIARKLKG